MTVSILVGDCREMLQGLADDSVHTCISSPPYYGLRDYGTATWIGGDPDCKHRSPTMRGGRNETRPQLAGSAATNSAQLLLAHRSACGKCGAVKADRQIGIEQSPEAFVAELVAVFREVRRVLRPDGTLWVNIGDSYASRPNGSVGKQSRLEGARSSHDQFRVAHALRKPGIPAGLKHKDLIGIPWMLAFALRADGWCLRQEIIWNKPNAMPESVKDRCTKSHETIFLLSKSAKATIWQAKDTGEWSSAPNKAETVPTPTSKNPDSVRPGGRPGTTTSTRPRSPKSEHPTRMPRRFAAAPMSAVTSTTLPWASGPFAATRARTASPACRRIAPATMARSPSSGRTGK